MKRRWLKRALLALLVGLPVALIVVLIAAVLLAPSIFTGDDVKREAVSALTETLGTPASIERVTYSPLGGIELFGVVIGPPDGFTEDVARIDRVAILYDLSGIFGRKVRVKELALENVRVVMETKLDAEGKPFSNIDAINKKLAENAQPAPEEEPKSPLKGPLSPLDITVEKIAVTDLSARLVGVGPQVSLSGLAFLADARLDRERLGARAKFTILPNGTEANLILDDPAQEVQAKLVFALTASTSVAAGASDGLALQNAGVFIDGRIDGDVRYRGNELPRLDVDLRGLLTTDPVNDTAKLSPLSLTLNQQTLLDLSVGINGVVALMGDLMGPPAAESLAATLGMQKRRPDGIIALDVRSVALPMGTLAPYASVFVPGLVASGSMGLSETKIEGTMLELIGGTPRTFALRLGFDRLAVTYPAANADVKSIDGAFTLEKESDLFALDGLLAIAGIKQGPNLVERSGFGLKGSLERLTYPLPGHSAFEVSLSGEGITAPPATVKRAEMNVQLAAEKLVSADRTGLPPIEVKASVKVDHVRTVTGTASMEVADLNIAMTALLDRLLEPAQQKIASTIDLSVGTVRGSDGLAVDRTTLKVAAELSDPRTKQPIDADATVSLTVASTKHPAATVGPMKIDLKTSARAVAPRQLPGMAPTWAPAFADWQLAMNIPDVVVHDKANGDIPTSVAVKTTGSVDLVRSTAQLRTFELDIWDALHVEAQGRFAKIFAKDLYSDAKLEVAPIDMEKLLAKVPRGLLDKYAPGLESTGKVGFTARVKGDLPQNFADIDLGAPPIDAEARLNFTDFATKLPSSNVDFSGMGGSVTVDVRRGRSELRTDLSITKVVLAGNSAETTRILDGVTFKSRAGLRGELFEIESNLDTSGKEPASFDIDLSYEKRGDLSLRRFDVRLPAAGIEMDVTGRLARRAFGVLRPELAVKMKLDLDRLATIVPEASVAHGNFAAYLEVLSPADTRVDIYGLVELDRFSYAKGTLAVDGATGRLPINQRLILPQPMMREMVASAEGVLGDDLERRLNELSNDFLLAKMVLDRQDIMLEAPRAADYQPLRPYYAEKGARLSIASVRSGPDLIKNIVLDGLWHSGVLRADRFAAQMWDGDLLGDLAIQVTPDLNGRLRMRGTFTNLNIDVPYSTAKKIPPVTDPEEKEEYEIAGTIDLRVELRERTITMKLDLTKLKKPTLDRLFGYLDPNNEKPSMDSAKFALKLSEVFGLEPVGGQFTIARNIVSMNVDFRRVWIPDHWALKIFAPARFVAIPIFGSMIVGNVNGALPKTSMGVYIEPIFEQLGLEAMLSQYLGGRVIAEDLSDRPELRTASP